ncbi:hypothetical protein [Streptomyces fagopyri]|uniref:hypothetical protein n=1 Tax=Streptomyces fagopyri TaxID=2662397 RepID=UPI00371F4BF1
MVKDSDWRVRDRVASKRRCPPELLERLADDPHDAVRRIVAAILNRRGRQWHV